MDGWFGTFRAALLTASLATVVLASHAPAFAASRTWTGAPGTDWSIADNWDPSGAPDPADNLTLLSGTPVSDGDVVTDGDGSITVLGSGTKAILRSLTVARDGAAWLSVLQGGEVLSSFPMTVGAAAGSDGNVTLTGTDTHLKVFGTGQLDIGEAGTGRMNIQNGALVDTQLGYIGHLAGSQGTVTVDNATWTNDDDFYVGFAGTGRLNIYDGATVASAESFIAYESGSEGTVTVERPESNWNLVHNDVKRDLYVGHSGSARLNIYDGAAVTANSGHIARQSGSVGTVNVQRPGSIWDLQNELYVGYDGSARLNILDGASVTNYIGYVGYQSGSSGVVTVAGAGSKWNNRFRLFVAPYADATVDVRDGATLESHDAFVGWLGGSDGTVTVDGTDSTWTNRRQFRMGDGGRGTLNIRSGGAVSTSGDPVYLGYYATAEGTVNVEGNGSTWTSSDRVYLGYNLNAQGTVNVEGNGSTWTGDGETSVGHIGTGTIAIRDGGVVSGTTTRIASDSRSSGTVRVAGAGSTFTASISLYVGDGGTGTMHISDGGQATTTTWRIGAQIGSQGTVDIAGTGSNFTADGILFAGFWGNSTLHVSEGGTLDTQYGYLAYWGPAESTTTIEGDGSAWNNTEEIRVGHYGDGTLNILDGATVSCGNAIVGALAGSVGTVTIRGDGSLWTTTGDLDVGVQSSGTLNLADGGRIDVGGTLHVEPSGTIDVGPGSARLSASVVNNGTINVRRGSVLTFAGPASGGGLFTGPGTFVFEDALAPGTSPAAITFEGNVVLEATATLAVELMGTVPGDDYDTITVVGDVTLGGVLDVTVWPVFPLQDGLTFQMIEALGEVTGAFDNVPNTGDPIGTFGGVDLMIRYDGGDGNDVLLYTPSPVVIPGDLDRDGEVDPADLARLLRGFGATAGATLYSGDADGDGDVDDGDLNLLLSNMGATAGGLSAGHVQTVPEPSALLLAAFAAAALSGRLMLRRSRGA